MRDPLPSWKEGTAKSTLVGFVERVIAPGTDFVPPAERIAVFDNDGTLWCEYPMQVQVFFALAQVHRLTRQNPELLKKPAFKAMMVDGDLKALAGLSKREVFEPAFATHAGMTVEEFRSTASQWLREARHPHLHQLFTQGAFAPMRELLDYLRENGFRTYIVTGGGVEFVRTVAESLYGIPPEQVIGSSTKMKVEEQGKDIVLRKLAELGSFDDRDEKVVNIALHLGRRPIFAFGNSDGDLAMLRYTLGGHGPRQAWYLHHDDGEREFAYDRDFRLSPFKEGLDHAADYGIGVVSMKQDWTRVFGEAA